MKALVLEGERRVAVRDVAQPEVPPGWALVRVRAVGVCGSEVGAYQGRGSRRVPPLIMGHEIAGELVDRRRLFRTDGRIVINPIVGCDACSACSAGSRNAARG